MGLNAVAAARRARAPVSVLDGFPETSPAMAAATRDAGMVGWEGELTRRADGLSLEQAVLTLPWWPATLVRTALATGRARSSCADYLDRTAAIEIEVADRVLGTLPHLEALVADLEWLVLHCEPGERPQLQALLRRGFPDPAAARAHALAVALHRFNEDCTRRAHERQGVDDPVLHLLLSGDDDPIVFGWSAERVAGARAALDAIRSERAHAVRADADVLAADPWETMTESRRTRALGLIEAAADRVLALPRP